MFPINTFRDAQKHKILINTSLSIDAPSLFRSVIHNYYFTRKMPSSSITYPLNCFLWQWLEVWIPSKATWLGFKSSQQLNGNANRRSSLKQFWFSLIWVGCNFFGSRHEAYKKDKLTGMIMWNLMQTQFIIGTITAIFWQLFWLKSCHSFIIGFIKFHISVDKREKDLKSLTKRWITCLFYELASNKNTSVVTKALLRDLWFYQGPRFWPFIPFGIYFFRSLLVFSFMSYLF